MLVGWLVSTEPIGWLGKPRWKISYIAKIFMDPLKGITPKQEGTSEADWKKLDRKAIKINR